MNVNGPLPVVMTSAALVLLLQLLRTRRMREKYAASWSFLGVAIIVLAIFPELLERAAQLLGVAQPTNLLFFAGGLVLYLVCIQASVELSRLEEDRRVLVEEVALLRLEVEKITRRLEDRSREEPPEGGGNSQDAVLAPSPEQS